jgi:hypothetical protein
LRGFDRFVVNIFNRSEFFLVRKKRKAGIRWIELTPFNEFRNLGGRSWSFGRGQGTAPSKSWNDTPS